MEEDRDYQNRFHKLKIPIPSINSSPEHPSEGTRTPPLQTLASVPFKWEEQPGKPRTCTDIIISMPELQLPPCRQMSMDRRIPKTPSPTAVLDGPYVVARPKFSSFRIFREVQIDSFSSCSSSVSPEIADVDFIGKKISKEGRDGKGRSGFFGSFRFSSPSVAKRVVCDDEESCAWTTDVKRKGSFYQASPARTHIWGAIYKGIKSVLPWKRSRNGV